MPIRIPDSLPATQALESENIFVMTEHRAMHQDIRPLKLLLLNLMPTKITTETQILRKLANTPLQIHVELLHTSSHDAHHVPEEHLETFYTTFDQVKDRYFDGLIITGAPVEKLDFQDVDYWDELCAIMEWSKTNVHSTLHICWGAQAGIYYHYGVPKYELPAKRTGVFQHRLVKRTSPLVRGFDDQFAAPHSRYTEVSAEAIEACPDLEIIADSPEAGVYIAKSKDSQNFFVFGHPEYDANTLAAEYARDRAKGPDAPFPLHYFPEDNPEAVPQSTWRAHAQLLYTNWLNYYVYQTTPYSLDGSAHSERTPEAAPAESAEDAPAPRADTATIPSSSVSEPASTAGFATAVPSPILPEPAPTTAPATIDSSTNLPKPAPHVHYERTPLPSELAAQKAAAREAGLSSGAATGSAAAQPTRVAAKSSLHQAPDPFCRAENEDDDGYDPYSDRPEITPFFEPNPWD